MKMIIDATNMVLGRLASFVAKKALNGEKVEVVNCENVVVTGTKDVVLEKYKIKFARGDPFHGPYIGRSSHMVVRRTIRGMVPHKRERGLKAYKRVRCHIGVPEALKNEKTTDIKGANVSKMSNLKYVRLGEICKLLGGRS
jgi:large subunit ribosomal protein L13